MRQVYYIRKATLKTADKRYSSTNNDYEMTFSSETEISACEDDDSSVAHIPSVTYNFLAIDELEKHPPNSTVGTLVTCLFCASAAVGEREHSYMLREIQWVARDLVNLIHVFTLYNIR